MKKNSMYFIVFVAFLLLNHQNAFANISVTDFLGRDVILEKPATRIVALAPHSVENIFSAGGGNSIIATVEYSDYPQEAKKIQRVGRVNTVSVEAIISLKPDLVVVWTTGQGSKVLSKLEALGVNVYASEPKNLSDIAKTIRDFGYLTDNIFVAEKNAKKFEQRLAVIANKYANLQDVSVMYQVWSKPILSFNGKHIVSEIIELCGGKNVFSSAQALVPKLNVESVIQANPQAIITADKNEANATSLDFWKKYASLTAVKNNHLFYLHPDIISRNSMRILDGTEVICDYLSQVRTRYLKK